MPRRRTQYPPYSTDPKLIPRIVDWMTVQQVPLHRANLTPAAFNTETLVEYLRTTFAPYRRKPLPAFRLVIERALPRAFEIRQLQAAANSNNSGGRNSRDRRRRDDEEEESEEPSSSSVSDSSSLDDEDDSDSEEFELDPGVRMMEVKDSNMLNSSLRNTYRTNSTAENNRLLTLRRQQQRQQQKSEQQQEGASSTAKSNTSNQNGSSEDTTPSSLSPPIDPSFSSPHSSGFGSSYSHEDNPSSSSFASSSSSSSTSFHHSSTVSTPFSSSGSSSSSVASHSSIPLASSALSSCSSTTTTTAIPSALSSLRESTDEVVINGENGTSNDSNSIQVMEEEESEGGDTSEPNSTDSLRRQKKRQRSSVPETSLTTSQTPANKTDANKQQPKQSQTPNKTHPQSKRRKRVLKQSSSQAKNIHFTNSTAVEDLVSGTNDENGDLSPSFSAPSIPTARYSDLGGIDECLQEVRELIEWPLLRPEIYSHLGVKPSTGVLLYGPPGCGKTLLANAIAGELGVPFFRVSAPEIVTGMSGQSESRIRRLFADAIAAAPAIIFIDEIDAITPKRETAEKEMTRRIVAQFLTCMDDLSNRPLDDPPVIIIGATNRPDSLDSALRRNGRFAREIGLGVPDEAARARILSVLSKQLRLAGDFNFREIAHKTPGFVGADLSALTREAATLAVHRVFHQLLRQPPQQQDSAATSPPKSEQVQNTNEEKEKEKENEMGTVESEQMMDVETQTLTSTSTMITTATSLTMSDNRELQARIELSDRLRLQQARLSPEELSSLAITMQDFEAAIKKVQPSAKREGFATIPDVTWDDVGALEEMRTELRLSILEPIRRPLTYGRMGISSKTGILLYGPPGCGKTLLAKAMANEGGFNFISVKGPELLNKYVGESEKAVREVFSRGSASSPCIIFFDEVDALCPRRDGGDGASSNSTQRVVNQLLTEMDGLTQRGNVAIIAATNRPDIIDSAILRPGRLDKLVYVPLPTPSERARILQTLTRKIPCHPSLDLPSIASHSRCNRFSGADLSALVREAALMAVQQTLAVRPEMKDWEDEPELLCLRNEHFEGAFMKVVPSVSEREERLYNNMQRKLKAKQEAAASAASSSIAPTLPITEVDSQSGPSSSSSNT